MKSGNKTIGKFVYGIFFIVVLPALLWLWSKYSAHSVKLPSIHSPSWGIGLFSAGMILIVLSMYYLKKHGKGLPMNAYPPEKLVRIGPYYIIRHPIYVGFGILLSGVSIWTGSASGLWLITPLAILGMIAVIHGHEKIDLERRFPDYSESLLLSYPQVIDKPAKIKHRLSAILWPLIFWLLGSNIVWFLYGKQDPVFEIAMKFDFPIALQWAGLFIFVIIIIILFLPSSRKDLREWIISAMVSGGIILYIALLWPAVGAQYFYGQNIESNIFNISIFNIPLIFFFSFHASWILLLARLYAKVFKKMKILIWFVGIILSFVIIMICKSYILNLLICLFIYYVTIKRKNIWSFLISLSEKIANSWAEWEFGPFRIINHGFYPGAGAFAGTMLAGFLTGSEYVWAIVIFAVVGLIISALWAQFIEGSEKLKRPFGFYGALVGIVFACFTVWMLNYNVWVVLGVFAVLMPWVQAIGRLRCLVNGCCHGSIVKDSEVGIKYTHPRSRVCGISNLKGKPLHPTPLYSIIWLFFVGFFLLSLWLNGSSFVFISGLYFLLTGIGRFVEESLRGEVQTPIIYGLRLYQWMAILSVIVGLLLTTFDTPRITLIPVYNMDIIWSSLTIGFITFFAMGVDFPRSNRRFSRLV